MATREGWKAKRSVLIADVEATRHSFVTVRQSVAQVFAMRSMTVMLIAISLTSSAFADPPHLETLARGFNHTVKPFLENYCLSCHGKARQEARLDLSAFTTITTVQADLRHWELVLARLKGEGMPPEDAPRLPSGQKREAMVKWIQDLRTYVADKNAGDPGLVLARRLNGSEYDYTIRDLTGVDIRPTREFPVDPANVAGFANSGESLTMSPALFNKYLDAARHVTDHLVLMPTGITFAPHPAVTYSDRDKFAVRRIVDFYLAQKTDFAEFLAVSWQFRHREALENPELTLAAAADSHGISRKYLATFWDLLHDGKNQFGPIAELREKWDALPAPADTSVRLPLAECREIRDWIVAERKKRKFTFPLVMIPQLNPSTQPGVLWRNRLIAEHRRKGMLSDEERQDEDLRRAIERFCRVVPDRFVRIERGRMNLPFEDQNKGRFLSAGFHLQVGYYRDDGPLYGMLLSDEQQSRLDELWRALYFVTDTPLRQFQDYIYFERAEGREIITEAGFDFARGEDRSVASRESMETFARLYVVAVRKRNLDEEAVAVIKRYFIDMSKRIRVYEQARVEAEPIHLQALLKFATRAWRRPLAVEESRQLLKFYCELREEDELSHEEAIRDAVTSILVSPLFCYRVDFAETENDGNRLTNYSLASRLSYFLWSSMPDEELIALAQADSLQQSRVLLQQVQRMLKDDRSQALAIEFAGNWLDFRQFQNHVAVDREKFPRFTDKLRQSMFQEPVHFISDLIRRDGSVRELLQAGHTFVDKNLAKHYEIPFAADSADENGWLRVDHAQDYGRGGLLPMSVFLTKNSPGLRTSPVKRGYWVVKQLLGERIPAPPPDVPEIPEDEADLRDLTLREVLRKHREVKSCAACHEKFDFAGLVLEGYGPIGERRSQDLGGKTVDDSTVFPDGTTGKGLGGLQAYLVKHRQEQFYDNVCRKLLGYGLGRSLMLSDESTIDRMKQMITENKGRFSSLIKVVVTSPQFLNKRPPRPVDKMSK